MFAAGGREFVIAGAAVVLRYAPLRLDPLFFLETVESGIERPFFNFEQFLGHLHDALADAIAVHRPQAERLENQQVKRALEQIRLLFTCHYVSPGKAIFPRMTRKHSTALLPRMSKGIWRLRFFGEDLIKSRMKPKRGAVGGLS